MSERSRRVGENEAVWRQINELGPPDRAGLSPVFCECGKVGCAERVLITAAEYEEVRSSPTTFVVAPGHAILDVERVVRVGDRFDVVDKHGEAAEVAEETDPREPATS